MKLNPAERLRPYDGRDQHAAKVCVEARCRLAALGAPFQQCLLDFQNSILGSVQARALLVRLAFERRRVVEGTGVKAVAMKGTRAKAVAMKWSGTKAKTWQLHGLGALVREHRQQDNDQS